MSKPAKPRGRKAERLPEPALLPGFIRNPGHCPELAKGKRVRVQLWHGREPKYAAEMDPMARPGWPASDGKPATRWEETGTYPFEIYGYRIIG
jgi:hypothetical protein